MRNPPPSTRITSWQGHKEQGRVHFQNEEYEEALASYRQALSPEFGCPTAERQIILSNVVACRLKIGGPAMASAAVEDAKQCIALNESWAKGHVRLASAYIALGGHSNDACNELQRAMSLDPGNVVARQMLMRELRRDRAHASEQREAQQQQQQPVPEEAVNVEDTTISWTDRLKFEYMRCVTWYHSQSDDVKTLLKVVLGLIVLYVAFGGRFGLEKYMGGGLPENRGNYEAGNVYDRYHRRNDAYNYDDYIAEKPQASRARSYDDDYTSYNYDAPPRTTSSRSFHFPNLFDGSPQSMLLLAGIAYLCYRNGINPFQALMMINLIGGRRRGGMGGMGRMGMYGMGGMAGYGMMRNAFGNRVRRGMGGAAPPPRGGGMYY